LGAALAPWTVGCAQRAPAARGAGTGAAAASLVVGVDRSDLPLAGASAAEHERFAAGDDLFELTFREADGLGPLYIRSSCDACHREDGRGPGLVGKMAVATGTVRAPRAG
jgi:CxxC motif-containing protein (DUF1111 family)